MNKAFEKILDMLEEERELSYADFSRYVEEVSPCLDDEYDDFFHRGLERASRLVREVAEEYNGGWIACSDDSAKLPKENEKVRVTVWTGIEKIGFMQYGKWFVYSSEGVAEATVVAWQPTEPYNEVIE